MGTLHNDLIGTLDKIRSGQTTASDVAEQCLQKAVSKACEAVFRELTPDRLRLAARATPPEAPLGGLPFSVKDLFDVSGQVTAAGSRVLADAPPARRNSPAVVRLLQAGAGLIGRTHMVEFAFSGVGVNPHFGTPAAWDALSDRAVGAPDKPHVPGGSSSGAAVSVATGAAFIGLGSDTGGSIRIPAALNGLVGFKSTARRVPTAGALPLSTTLDTVCAITRSTRDAILAHEVLSARQVPRTRVAPPQWRLAVARDWMLEGLDAHVSMAFDRALKQLRHAGYRVDEIPMPALLELPDLMQTGGFSPPESYAWHQDLLARQVDLYDPRVAFRILRGQHMKAHEYIELMDARSHWIRRMTQAMSGYDAMLSPTTPITGPTLESVAPGTERDEAFFRINTLLLRNTSVVNNLDGCAISLPCHRPGELPVGLMLWQGPMQDDRLLNLALQMESVLVSGETP